MQQTNHVFLLTLCVIVLGFLLKKYNFVSEKDGKTISKFLMHTTFPALMLVSTARVKLDFSLILIPILCIACHLVMLAIAWFVFKKYPNQLRGLFLMGFGATNTGLFGFPIIESLFGKEGLDYAIMLDIGNTMVAFGIIYPIGRYFAPDQSHSISIKEIFKRVFSLPPVLAMILGLTINFSEVQIPPFFYDFLDVLAKGNKPIVLLLMGIYLSFDLDKKQIIGISKVLLIRYLIFLIGVALVYHFVDTNLLMRNVLIVCLVLPLGMTILPFSDEMNYDSRIAGTLLNVSLLISFVLMWSLVVGLGLVR
jgi:malate permease and related proteins